MTTLGPVTLEQKRYDPEDPFKIVMVWKGTILPLTLLKLDTWLYIIFYVSLEIAHEVFDTPLPVFPFKTITISSGLLSFFLVFYNQAMYQRFMKLYEHTVSVGGCVKAFAQRAAVFLDDQPKARWQAVRYLLASLSTNFYFLKDGTLSITEEQWDAIISMKLLTKDEAAHLQKFGGRRYELLHSWTLTVTKGALAGEDRPSLDYLMLNECVAKQRENQAMITNLMKLPLPFAYCHLMNVMICLNFIPMAYAVVLIEGYIAGFVFIFVVICTIGHRLQDARLAARLPKVTV